MADSATRSTKSTSIGNDNTSAGARGTPQHTTRTTLADAKKTTLSSAIKGAPVEKSSSESTSPESARSGAAGSEAAVTTSPLPAGHTNVISAADADPQPTGLSQQSRNAIITVSILGGILLLAILIYIIWRRQRGATNSGLICFRRDSDTITLGTTQDGRRLTALPIYQETRYSVRSSRFGSTLSFGRVKRRPSGVPATVAQRFHKENPWIQTAWKSENPPTPTTENHPLDPVMPSPPSPSLKQLGMVRVYSSQSGLNHKTKNDSQDTTKSGPAVTIAEPVGQSSPTGSIFGFPHESPKAQAQHRWSWTNSQAPPTPKLAASSRSRRSSLSSLPKYKRVKSWVRGQANRQGIRIEEEPLPSSQRSSVPVLKNKASKPNLAPKAPTRKLSKRKKSDGGNSLNALRPYPDMSGITAPASAKVPDHRPRTAQHNEADDLTISYS